MSEGTIQVRKEILMNLAVLIVAFIAVVVAVVVVSSVLKRLNDLDRRVKTLEETAVRRGKDGRFLRRSTDIPAVSE
jgi:uncharacterized membrane protein YvbJ